MHITDIHHQYVHNIEDTCTAVSLTHISRKPLKSCDPPQGSTVDVLKAHAPLVTMMVNWSQHSFSLNAHEVHEAQNN